MTSAAPARKPYRKAPPQHRETRHALPVALPTPAPPHGLSQVNQPSSNTPPTTLLHRSIGAKQAQGYGVQRGGPKSPLPRSDSELEVSSVSSLEVCVPPSARFSSQSQRTQLARAMTSQSPAAVRKASPSHRLPEDRHHSTQWSHTAAATATAPKSILKQPGCLGLKHTYDIIRKSQSVELLGDGRGEDSYAPQPPIRFLHRSERCRNPRRSSHPSSPCGTRSNQKMHVLKEKVRFSNFLDEITCRVMSPAHLRQLGKTPSVKAQGHSGILQCRSDRREWQSEETSAERSRRWDNWVSAVQRPNILHMQEEAGHWQGNSTDRVPPKREKGVKRDVQKRHKHLLPLSNQSALSHIKVGLHGPPVALGKGSWRNAPLFGNISTCVSWRISSVGTCWEMDRLCFTSPVTSDDARGCCVSVCGLGRVCWRFILHRMRWAQSQVHVDSARQGHPLS